jgi:hypothetical protein
MTRRLEVVIPDRPEPLVFPAEVDSEFEIKETGHSIRVVRYIPDFVMDLTTREVGSKSHLPNNPAIQVEITGPDGPIKQWIFAKLPSMHASVSAPFEIRFRMETHLIGIADYVLIIGMPENRSKENIVVAHIRNGAVVAKENGSIGQQIDIGETGGKMVVDRLLKNTNMLNEVINRPDISDQGAIEVVVDREGLSEKHYLWEDSPEEIAGLKMVYFNENRIRDFYSILQIISEGEVVAEKKIEVNDPLRYGGYALYQSSWDDENLSWSGLQVKKDPGVPLVYAGFLIQILGMIVVFYVNPFVRKTKKSRA